MEAYVSDREIHVMIEKYARYYTSVGKIPKNDIRQSEIRSEIGWAITRAIRGWAKVTDKTAKFVTYADRAIKNHMKNYRRDTGRYMAHMCMTDDCDSWIPEFPDTAIPDALSAFEGADYHIASEFLHPSPQVMRIMQAIRAKFRDTHDLKDLGHEKRLLKAGVDCFAISLVYGIGIRKAEEIKSRIHNELSK